MFSGPLYFLVEEELCGRNIILFNGFMAGGCIFFCEPDLSVGETVLRTTKVRTIIKGSFCCVFSLNSAG